MIFFFFGYINKKKRSKATYVGHKFYMFHYRCEYVIICNDTIEVDSAHFIVSNVYIYTNMYRSSSMCCACANIINREYLPQWTLKMRRFVFGYCFLFIKLGRHSTTTASIWKPIFLFISCCLAAISRAALP